MAGRALVDTTVLYAAANRSERHHHRQALAIVKGADRGELPRLVVSDAAWMETVNGLHRDLGHAATIDFARRIETGARFHLLREPKAVWSAGRELFRERERLSLADALQVACARHHGIDYIYSFGDGFEGLDDLRRLAAPTNPFDPGEGT